MCFHWLPPGLINVADLKKFAHLLFWRERKVRMGDKKERKQKEERRDVRSRKGRRGSGRARTRDISFWLEATATVELLVVRKIVASEW